MATKLLHVIFAALLVIAVGIPVKPSNAYRTLTYLRIFSIIVVLGLLTVAGLAYLKIDSWIHGSRSRTEDDAQLPDEQRRGRRWLEKRQWTP
jgi:hypothetical protein